MSAPILDHEGKPVEHGRAKVNGTSLHYVKAGAGEPVILLHGIPKTHYYWRHVIPLLTPHYTVVAHPMPTSQSPSRIRYGSVVQV